MNAQNLNVKRAIAREQVAEGTYSNLAERLTLPVYDTQVINNAVLEHRYFEQGVGRPFTVGGAGNKTQADANFTSAAVPVNNKYTVYGIGLLYQQAEIRSLAELFSIHNLLSETVFTLTINGKDRIWQATGAMTIGSTFPVVVDSAATNIISTPTQDNLIRFFPLRVPQTLAAQTEFLVEMEHKVAPAAGLDGDKIKIWLDNGAKRLS